MSCIPIRHLVRLGLCPLLRPRVQVNSKKANEILFRHGSWIRGDTRDREERQAPPEDTFALQACTSLPFSRLSLQRSGNVSSAECGA